MEDFEMIKVIEDGKDMINSQIEVGDLVEWKFTSGEKIFGFICAEQYTNVNNSSYAICFSDGTFYTSETLEDLLDEWSRAEKVIGKVTLFNKD